MFKQSAPQTQNRGFTTAVHHVPGGFSLVELLIAMTLGLILISGMIAVFAGNKRSSDLNSAMADIQENARFALDNLAGDIRMSGFQGCLDLNRGAPKLLGNGLPTNNLVNTAAMASVVQTANLWVPAPPIGFQTANHNAMPGTHALTLQFGSAATFPLDESVNIGGIRNSSGPIIVNTTPGISQEEFSLQAGNFAIISDCVGADIFQVSSVSKNSNKATVEHSASVNESGALTHRFEGGADSATKFMRFVSNVYYVGDTGLANENGDKITALYQQSLPYGDTDNPATELVRGVENMRLTFGIRTGNESLTYVIPTDPQYDPSAVESIRIGLLMSSYDRVANVDDENTYLLAGQAIVPTGSSDSNAAGVHQKDRRYRLAFNTTVKIRNRRN